MVAASTVRTRSGRGKRTTTESENSDGMELEQLRVRITEVAPQRPAVGKKLPTGKPFMFAGTRDDQKIFTWLSRTKTQHQVSAIAMGIALTEEEKIIVAISYLDDVPRRQYDVRVGKNGEFDTYHAFEKWIKKNYVPTRHAHKIPR